MTSSILKIGFKDGGGLEQAPGLRVVYIYIFPSFPLEGPDGCLPAKELCSSAQVFRVTP